MTTLLDSIRFSDQSLAVLTSATKVLPGISELNLEKALVSVLPDVLINSVSMKENFSQFYVDMDISFPFDFNIKPFQDLIGKFFKLKITKLSTNSQGDTLKLLENSLFSTQGFTPSLGDSRVISEVSLPFSAANMVKTNLGTRYDFLVRHKNLDIDKNKNGESYINPKYVFYTIKSVFDTLAFEKEFDVQSLKLINANGKAKAVSVIINGLIDGKEWKNVFKGTTQEWLGATNEESSGTYSFSKLYYDSREVELNTELLGSKLKQETSLSGLIKEAATPKKQTIRLKAPRISVHPYGAISSPIQIFFDIDWLGLVYDNVIQKDLVLKNPSLSSNVKILSMKVYRERVDSKDSKIYLGNGQEVNGIINFSNDKIKILEKKYDLDPNNDHVRSFIITDSSFDATPIQGKYQYSLVMEMENNISKVISDKRKELMVTQRDIISIQEQSLRGLVVDEGKYLSSIKTTFDSLALLTNKNITELKEEVNKTYSFSNPITGTPSGLAFLSEGVQQTENLFKKIDDLNRLGASGKTSSEVNKSNFTFEHRFLDLFTHGKTGISFLEPTLEKPIEVEQFLVNRIYPSELETTNLEQIKPTKVIYNGQETNFVGRKDALLFPKKQTSHLRGALDENLPLEEESQIVSFKNFLADEGAYLEFADNPPISTYSIDDSGGSITNNNNSLDVTLNTEDTIFDVKLSGFEVLPFLEKLIPKVPKLPVSEIQYLSGYTTSGDQLLMKSPKWVTISDLTQIQGKSVLCRYNIIEEGDLPLPVMNKYFVLGDIEKVRSFVTSEVILLEELEEMHTNEKLRIL